MPLSRVFFFFQAEDGIRDLTVTGVQTCALPISLRDDAPRRVRLLEEAGGPDTLLHGDLWPKNVFVSMTPAGPRARLIDWDHVGVGPASYDVSTFLYQSAADERPTVLRRYREAVERTGWRLPDDGTLNVLFHTMECARYAHCVHWAGAPPPHVDSPPGVPRPPRALPYVRALARRVGVPLRGSSDVRHFPKFYGQWGGETHLEQIGVDGLLRLLDAELGPGVTELTCHPGYVDEGLASSYTVEREAELRTLCDPRVRPALAERGIRLAGVRDLPAAVAPLSVSEGAA